MGDVQFAGSNYVDVALPVPVSHAFTYKIPPHLSQKVGLGARVAVPFSGRKLAGIVVELRDSPPQEMSRIRAISAVMDQTLFPRDLLAFLQEAARYYLHPLGEVLRAAAPAVPKDTLAALRRDGFLEDGEAFGGAKASVKKRWFVRSIAHAPQATETTSKLGPKQAALWARIQERPEWPLDDLAQSIVNPRPALRRLAEKGLVVLEAREAPADPFFGSPVPRAAVVTANAAQRAAIESLEAAVERAAFRAFLLHGVTGSGKTEVYLQAIARARALGRGALVLVPEIALTPQLVARFRSRFGDDLAVLHSGLGTSERYAAWCALRKGRFTLAIGARSALFAPVADLGVVVVDEEHDPSFKQEEGFRYHARDMALLRAKRAGAVCVLGSATPSLESYHLCESGRMELLSLPDRATRQALPQVEIVDLNRNRTGPSGHPLLSAPLHRAIESALSRGEQTLLFLNRRGFAPSVRCVVCGLCAQCPSCSVSLTQHRSARSLRCHYCDFKATLDRACEGCGSCETEAIGVGTEQLEDLLAQTFAPARVERLDRDTGSSRGVEAILGRFRRGEIDILVGTQMITKGHDVPGVTVVGVVLADQSLSFPDFRAAERTFQLLAQVAGRAGRGEHPGSVFFQTFQPGHEAIRRAATHDYEGFYRAEIRGRREFGYAPFSRLACVRLDAPEEARVRRAAGVLSDVARGHEAVRSGKIQVLGPAPAPIGRLRGRYRYRLLLRGTDRRMLRAVSAALSRRIDEGFSTVRASVDIDPVSML